MKHTNDQVAKAFARGGIAESGNLSAKNYILKSYNTHIGVITNGICYLSEDNHSATTSKHIGLAHRAARLAGYEVVCTEIFSYGNHIGPEYFQKKNDQVAMELFNRAVACYEKSKRARIYKSNWMDSAGRYLKQAMMLCQDILDHFDTRQACLFTAIKSSY